MISLAELGISSPEFLGKLQPAKHTCLVGSKGNTLSIAVCVSCPCCNLQCSCCRRGSNSWHSRTVQWVLSSRIYMREVQLKAHLRLREDEHRPTAGLQQQQTAHSKARTSPADGNSSHAKRAKAAATPVPEAAVTSNMGHSRIRRRNRSRARCNPADLRLDGMPGEE